MKADYYTKIFKTNLGKAKKINVTLPYIRCRCVALPYTEHLTGRQSPDTVMAEQDSNIGNAELVCLIESLLNNQNSAIRSIIEQSRRLIDENFGDLTRIDLPHDVDRAKGWTGGIMGLRKSERTMKRLESEGKSVPPAWAIHHWSIDSSYLVDRYRKSKWLTDSERQAMENVTDKAQKLLGDIFSDNKAIIKKPIVLHRGISLPKEKMKEIESQLLVGNSVEFEEISYNSNTVKPNLARQFALSSAGQSGGIPIIHKSIVQSGVRGIDITELNYYDEQEIILENGLSRKIIGMKRHDDGSIELTSINEPKNNYVGDTKPRNDWIDIEVSYPNDAHMNKVSGVVARTRVGVKLSDIKLDI